MGYGLMDFEGIALLPNGNLLLSHEGNGKKGFPGTGMVEFTKEENGSRTTPFPKLSTPPQKEVKKRNF